MSWPTEQPPSDVTPAGAADTAAANAVDVRALAEKVYRLLLAEARLELARGGRVRRREG